MRSRMNVRMPANRGISSASSGLYGGRPRREPTLTDLARAFTQTNIRWSRVSACEVARRRLATVLVLAGAVSARPRRREPNATGIDVSHWQGAIEWPRSRAAAIEFAFAKATEGRTSPTRPTRSNRAGARRRAQRRRVPLRAPGRLERRRAHRERDRAGGLLPRRRAAAARRPAAGARPRGERWACPAASGSGRGVARRGRRADRRPARRSTRRRASGRRRSATRRASPAPGTALDRALDDEGEPLVPGGELGRARLDVLAVDSDCTVPGIRALRRRRPLQRRRARRRRDPAYPAAPPLERAADDRRHAADREAARRPCPGSWAGGKPLAFGYQWQRCDAAGAGCIPIAGATAPRRTRRSPPTSVTRSWSP